MPAEGLGGGAVKLSELFAESLPILFGTVFEFDKFEDEAGAFFDNFAKDGAGNAYGLGLKDGTQGTGLGLEKAHSFALAIFEEKRCFIVGV